MQISLRLRLDDERDALVVELDDGAAGTMPNALKTAARTIPLGPLVTGGERVQLEVDADGYITAAVIPGVKAFLAELDAEQRKVDEAAKKSPAPPPKRAG